MNGHILRDCIAIEDIFAADLCLVHGDKIKRCPQDKAPHARAHRLIRKGERVTVDMTTGQMEDAS